MIGVNGNKTLGFMTIRQVTLDYKERWEDFSAARTMHFEKMVIKAVTDLSIFTMNTTEVVYLEVGANSTIELPPDYINYTKIGVIDAYGALWTLTLNKEAYPAPGELCGVDITSALRGQQMLPDNGYNFAPHYYGGAYRDTLYSAGGGFNTGYYNVNRQGGYLIITGLPEATQVVMEYKSTGVRLDGKTMIPREAFESIIAWINWKEADMGKNGMNPQAAKQTFLEEERRLKAFQQKLTMNEWQDAIASTYSQSVKR